MAGSARPDWFRLPEKLPRACPPQWLWLPAPTNGSRLADSPCQLKRVQTGVSATLEKVCEKAPFSRQNGIEWEVQRARSECPCGFDGSDKARKEFRASDALRPKPAVEHA